VKPTTITPKSEVFIPVKVPLNHGSVVSITEPSVSLTKNTNSRESVSCS